MRVENCSTVSKILGAPKFDVCTSACHEGGPMNGVANHLLDVQTLRPRAV